MNNKEEPKKFKKILLIGPQASGKGTQAARLAEKFEIPIFSTGNILRQRIGSGDELGKQAETLVNSGQLVPDELVNQIIQDKIWTEGVKGFVLDGYPRNMAQAEFLSEKNNLTHVFEVAISDEEAIKRVGGRRTCPVCQAVYHTEYNPPKTPNICDKCGATLIIRDDEKEEVIKQRLKNYHELTEPLLSYYGDKGILHKINGQQPIQKVTEDILKVFEDDNN